MTRKMRSKPARKRKKAPNKPLKTSSSPGRSSIREAPFRKLLQVDEELAEARRQYARKTVGERRLAAEFAYHGAQAERIVLPLFGREPEKLDQFRGELLALAIDPEYAPALLTVGTLEYELGRSEEALDLLRRLTTLPRATEDLPEIIDKAGDYLIDKDDIQAALDLYLAAVRVYPGVALYHSAAGYCLGRLGDRESAVDRIRRAVELDPDNHLWLNDLGWSLMEIGNLTEAEEVLERAVALAPPDYELAKGNLMDVRRRRSGNSRQPRGKKARTRRRGRKQGSEPIAERP
jgi:tetratricopeptide (TPR) repeat protein